MYCLWRRAYYNHEQTTFLVNSNLRESARITHWVLQIEGIFDIYANGILLVTVIEKSTNKENNITITNNNGSLSKEDIELMVNDAEKYRIEDEKRDTNSTWNALELHCFNIKAPWSMINSNLWKV